MRLFLLMLFFLILESCTTVETTKEIIKASNSIKTTITEIVSNKEDDSKINEDKVIESKTEERPTCAPLSQDHFMIAAGYIIVYTQLLLTQYLMPLKLLKNLAFHVYQFEENMFLHKKDLGPELKILIEATHLYLK